MQLKHSAAALLITSVIGASACSTPTTISDTWRDPNYSATPMRKMLVLARGPSETTRRSAEDAFAAALGQHGVQTSTAYHVFPEQQPDRQAVRAYLQAGGYDGALVAAFKGTHSVTTIEPGADFDGYYGAFWGEGGYVETDQYVKVETTLWDPHTGKLVWSATSQTENPTSSNDAISSVTSKIVTTLSQARLIPPVPVASTYASKRFY